MYNTPRNGRNDTILQKTQRSKDKKLNTELYKHTFKPRPSLQPVHIYSRHFYPGEVSRGRLEAEGRVDVQSASAGIAIVDCRHGVIFRFWLLLLSVGVIYIWIWKGEDEVHPYFPMGMVT